MRLLLSGILYYTKKRYVRYNQSQWTGGEGQDGGGRRRGEYAHEHASPGTGSSGFSARSVSLPAIHEPSLDDSNGDADSKVDAHHLFPI